MSPLKLLLLISITFSLGFLAGRDYVFYIWITGPGIIKVPTELEGVVRQTIKDAKARDAKSLAPYPPKPNKRIVC